VQFDMEKSDKDVVVIALILRFDRIPDVVNVTGLSCCYYETGNADQAKSFGSRTSMSLGLQIWSGRVDCSWHKKRDRKRRGLREDEGGL
jgi:uncharacterized protein YodC (DUF2158 family)